MLSHPLPIKAATSGVAYTLGDFTCQLSQGKSLMTVDLKRSLRSGVAAGLAARAKLPVLLSNSHFTLYLLSPCNNLELGVGFAIDSKLFDQSEGSNPIQHL